jgi:choline-sulfatase
MNSPRTGLDGESLVQDLKQPGRTRDTTVYSEFNLANNRAKYMIRRGDFKYNYYKSDTPELYDLKRDPKEMRNLANSAEHRGKLEELKAQLFAWHRPA